MTLAVWSHGSAVFPVVGTLVAFAIVVVLRDARHLIRDVAVLVGAAVVTTGLLEVGSTLVLGDSRFISLTLDSWSFLNKPGVLAHYHSTSWAWAPYRVYLLVLPTVVIAFGLAFARRLRAIPTPQLLVGLGCTAQSSSPATSSSSPRSRCSRCATSPRSSGGACASRSR